MIHATIHEIIIRPQAYPAAQFKAELILEGTPELHHISKLVERQLEDAHRTKSDRSGAIHGDIDAEMAYDDAVGDIERLGRIQKILAIAWNDQPKFKPVELDRQQNYPVMVADTIVGTIFIYSRRVYSAQ